MHLETTIKSINASSEDLYTFLNSLENFDKIMPENTDKFELIDESSFVFSLSGMPNIVLRLKESTPNQRVVLGAASEKLPFTLKAEIKSITADQSEFQLHFDGDFNTMMAMMIKSPLQKFIDTLSDNISTSF